VQRTPAEGISTSNEIDAECLQSEDGSDADPDPGDESEQALVVVRV
jgi:hypothetical protein